MPRIPRGYIQLAGSERRVRSGLARTGPADPKEESMVSIYLRKPVDAPALPSQEDFASAPKQGRLSREELGRMYAADPDDLAAVVQFAEKAGLTVTALEPERRLIQVTGTNAQLSKAFAVELVIYEGGREGYRGHEGPIHIPKSLDGIVAGVFGLDNRRMARRAGGGGVGAVTPPQVAQAYNFPTPTNGASGETVAILEFSGPTSSPINASTCGFAQSDIDGFINNLNSSAGSHLVSTTVKAVAVDKSTAAPGNVPGGSATNFTPSDPDVEVALDIEVVVSLAQQANVVVYFAPITEQGWVDAITQIVADTTHDPSVLSISWGWTEAEADAFLSPEDPESSPWPFEWSQSAFNQMTSAFQSAATVGMTVFAATGDDGSDCQEQDGNAHVLYPASDSWVTACGGTIINSLSPLTEDTWNDNSGGSGGATGGGISELVDPVSWQAGANIPKSVNSDHRKGRGLPDIAGNASPNSGYNLWLYGQSTSSLAFTGPAGVAGEVIGAIGGTSAVAPLYASLVALINASLQTRVGYLNPLLYQLEGSDVFRDINDGVSNAVTWTNEDDSVGGPSLGYSSGAGWDACTGLGSVDGAALLDACTTVYKKQISFYMEDTTFSQDEVELQPGTAHFSAGWIAMDNFLPSQLGLTHANLANPPASSLPKITFTPDPSLPSSVASAISAMIGPPKASGPVLPVDPTLPNAPQRFLFPFTLTFNGVGGFTAMAGASTPIVSTLGTLKATLNVPVGSFANTTQIELTTGQDPRFEDINPSAPTDYPSWESFDLRVFKMTVAPGGSASRFGATIHGPDDAPAFIAKAMDNLTAKTTGSDTFESLSQDENSSELEFQQRDDNGNYVYNFALARVRLAGKHAATAKNVRVFFRLFQAQNTVSNFDEATTYRYATDGVPFGHRIPLLGVGKDQNGTPEYVTIPCFATERIVRSNPSKGMADQTDPPNARDIETHAGVETDYYFGCWIDNNQQYGIMPASFPSGAVPPAGQSSPSFDGPWSGVTLEPMLTAFTAFPHQCMIAEIRYDDTPVPAGATTSTSDKLAQRNIAWLDAPNPGMVASRRVAHPIQVRPTPAGNAYPDELMITWGDTPRGSTAELYFPNLKAAEILKLRAEDEPGGSLYQVDANTVGCATGDVTFVPLPQAAALAAGLLTVTLPPGITKGEVYNIGVRQFTNRSAKVPAPPPPPPPIQTAAAPSSEHGGLATWRALEGSFQFVINVSTKQQLLFGEERLLATLKWLELHTSPQKRWYPVLNRYIGDVAGRVAGFGGDPGKILPSPIGQIPGWPLHGGEGGGHGPVVPHPCEPPVCDEWDAGLTGKVAGLLYDHFGDFDGFVLELESGVRHRFESREPAVRELAHHAWLERTLVTVFAEGDCHRVPRAIELRV